MAVSSDHLSALAQFSTPQSSILNGSIFRSSEYISGSYELRYLTQSFLDLSFSTFQNIIRGFFY